MFYFVLELLSNVHFLQPKPSFHRAGICSLQSFFAPDYGCGFVASFVICQNTPFPILLPKPVYIAQP
jgi:hypothetical protein